VKRLQPLPVDGDFFREPDLTVRSAPKPRSGWWDWAEAFGRKCEAQSPENPDWFLNVVNSKRGVSDKPWHEIPDFDESVGDIKGVWEASRMDWLFPCAQRALSADSNVREEGLTRLNKMIKDWSESNPQYTGTNWKCGQEVSIRVMHLAMTALLLKQTGTPAPALINLIRNHAQRIEPTIMYAIAQNNNHGTSEAAALYIAGSWLRHQGVPEANRWYRKGKKWLEDRVKHLIVADGTFSQRSVNYHRLMLDTLSMVELWRREFGMEPFSEHYQQKCKAATAWLGNFTEGKEGDAPNLGANDGARLLPLTDTDYRDFRPSVQLATVLFFDAIAYPTEGSFNEPLEWLGIKVPDAAVNHKRSKHYSDGGFAVLRNERTTIFITYPKFRFRASGNDALHVDLWVDGETVLCDSGSYCYNADDKAIQAYFKSVAAHNTVQFDEREQMVQLSRFLAGGWPKIKAVQFNQEKCSFSVSIKDFYGVVHSRVVTLNEKNVVVHDSFKDFRKKAILRWRLAADKYKNQIHCSAPVRLTEGFRSLYYGKYDKFLVIESEIHAKNLNSSIYQVQTKICF